jgi:hypothetical protein
MGSPEAAERVLAAPAVVAGRGGDDGQPVQLEINPFSRTQAQRSRGGMAAVQRGDASSRQALEAQGRCGVRGVLFDGGRFH